MNQLSVSFFCRFLATIDKPYVQPYESRYFEDNGVKVGYNSRYNEEKGDSCYARMLGTYVEKGRYVYSMKFGAISQRV